MAEGMASPGLPFPGLEADTEAAVRPQPLQHKSSYDGDSAQDYASLRKSALGHIDPQQHSRHAVYRTSKVWLLQRVVAIGCAVVLWTGAHDKLLRPPILLLVLMQALSVWRVLPLPHIQPLLLSEDVPSLSMT